MALLDILTTTMADVFLDTDPQWRQFITDHKTYLRQTSPQRKPSAELMTQVGRDLTWYLRYIGVQRPIAWIVAYINDLDSDVYFDCSTTLWVPDISQIDLLYQSYITTKQVKK